MNNGLWWNIKDSNLEPAGYEPDALTCCANVPWSKQRELNPHRLLGRQISYH